MYASTGAVAAELGVTARAVRRWCAERRVRCRRTVGGHYRVDVADARRLTAGGPSVGVPA
jgi:DNA-binding transcriptional MerR regulator